jgi:cysteine desulfurase / selenocysteine lyase
MIEKTIYLNNNSTSFPKPESVIKAVDRYLYEIPSSPNRSGFKVTSVVDDCRHRTADFFHVTDPRNIVFTSGSTEALNLAIFGLENPKHIITTTTEHNSVLRPLKILERDKGLELSIIDCDNEGFVDPKAIQKVTRKDTSAIVLNHCSNVTGAIQDITTISKIAQENNILLIVDASQSAGAVDIDLQKTHIDMLAFTGHKYLFATTGIGGLIIHPHVRLKPLKVGGTGIRSDYLYQPEDRPIFYEAGTPNTLGMVALSAGIKYITEKGINTFQQSKIALYSLLVGELENIPGIILYGGTSAVNKVPVVNFGIKGGDVGDLGYMLEESFDIIVRSGLHCAPLIHQSLGSFPKGTIRVSFSHFNTMEEVNRLVVAIKQIVGNFS